MSNPMVVRSLTLVATPVLNSPRAEAHQAIAGFGGRADCLHHLTDYIVDRKY